MAHHTLRPERRTLHAHFSCDRVPAVEIDPGDTVTFQTLDVSWGLEPPTSTTAPRRKFEPRDPTVDNGPCLIGPVGVRGAEPGDTLEIRIEALEPAPWGWTYAGPGITPPELIDALGIGGAPLALMRWSIDNATGTALNQFGHSVRIAPFLGIIGLSPGEPGSHSGWTPRACGGNMDCREIIVGTSLFLPVQAPDALVSIGDGHARQGEGEVSGTAIECMMDRATLRFHLHTGVRITAPRARTPTGWVTMGFGATLDEAMRGAVNAMLDLVMEMHHLARPEALALASVCMDLRITQIVNGTVGVHAVVADGAVGSASAPRP
jgi:acetamidase/formamidase